MTQSETIIKEVDDLKKNLMELMSYQENRIAELEAENGRLKKAETADDFVERLMEETKKLFFVDRKKADIIRQVLLRLNRNKEHQDLAEWIFEKPTRKKATKKIIQKNINSQVFNGNITDSEFK